MKEKILIEVVISNQCNKRCPYCKLDFQNTNLGSDVKKSLISFIKKNQNEVHYFHLNFFGGEALLDFESIQNIIESLGDSVRYSLGTNGILLDEEKCKYLLKNNVAISLSIDTETGNFILEKAFLKYVQENIEINFILNPWTIQKSFLLLEKVCQFRFRKINVMPVFSTIPWDRNTLVDFGKFLKYIKKYEHTQNIKKFSYFNGFSAEKQFMLDTDGSIFQDLDSLLWIQKQNATLSSELKKYIETSTYIGKIGDMELSTLLDSYNEKDIHHLVLDIPKEQKLQDTYIMIQKLIDSI